MESRSPSDFFSLLGVPRAYAIDRGLLDRRYLEESKRWHPDRFVGASPHERRDALTHSSALNEGYATLRDPIRRAEYLVRLAGVDLDANSADGGPRAPDHEFLSKLLERREQLEACRTRGPQALERLREEVAGEVAQALTGATAAIDEQSPQLAAEHLLALRYLRRLLDEVDGALEAV